MIWNMDPKNIKKEPKSLKSRPGCPRGGRGGSYFGPQSCRGLKNGGKMSVPGSPSPPPKVTIKWQSHYLFALFFMCFSKLVFWRARDLIFYDLWIQNKRKIGPAWCLFGVLFPCLFLIRFFIVFFVFFYRCQFCENVVFDAEPCVFLSGFDMAALLECFESTRNAHPTHHKNL